MMEFHRITLGQTSCYLISLTSGYLMVDCGSQNDEKQLRSKLKKLNISLASIHYLLLTHHHGDHCGLLNFIKSHNPELKVIMSRLCAEYLTTGHNQEKEENFASPFLAFTFSLLAKAGIKMQKTFPVYEPCPDDILLTASFYLIDVTGQNMTVLPAPGHTPDSILLLCDQHVFVGDACRNLMNLLGAPYEPICQEDPDSCLKTIDHLLAQDITCICPGHGPCFPPNRLKRIRHNHPTG